MKTTDFDFELPQNLIAQEPVLPRDASRLLVLDRKKSNISHKIFSQIYDFFEPGDLLVLNQTKVMPARLMGIKKKTGAKIELLLLRRIKGDVWECIAKPSKKLKPGVILAFGAGELKAEVISEGEDSCLNVRFFYEGLFEEVLHELGQMPLPPYIKKKLIDKNNYQTVYAREFGSAAAPTAGLHFTFELIRKLKEKGINITFLTLHVGLGTFRPVKAELIFDHKMHQEYFSITPEAADMINKTKKECKKVIAVGTTSVRTLESAVNEFGQIKAQSGQTDIFIYPGYEFKVVDSIITNFHLPKSTLLMLVSAFAGEYLTKKAYAEAIDNKYRFYSFGDAMLIL